MFPTHSGQTIRCFLSHYYMRCGCGDCTLNQNRELSVAYASVWLTYLTNQLGYCYCESRGFDGSLWFWYDLKGLTGIVCTKLTFGSVNLCGDHLIDARLWSTDTVNALPF